MTAKNSIDLRESEPALKVLVGDILEMAMREGASAAEVSASEDVGLSVTVRKGELETVEFNQDRGFGITVYCGKRKGSASTSDSSPGSIRETVRAARNIARHTQEDPCCGLADGQLMARRLPALDLYHPWQLDAGSAEKLALACEAAGMGHDPRIVNSDGAQVSTQQSCRVYGNTNDFLGSHVGTRHSLSCMLIGEDDAGMQRDYWYTVAREPQRLENPDAVGVEAARRTVARLSPRKTATGRFPVLFVPQMAAGLVGHLIGAISGSALYRNASFLPDSLGETVTAAHLSIREEPHLRGQMGSAAFDGDGVATRAKAFVDNGVVRNYVLSSYSARKLKMTTTGNAGGVFNVTVTGETRPVPALYAAMNRGLVVTELMGQGVNSVTGDYSRGASGFWVDNGQIAYPVDEITIASNLRDMYLNVELIGDDVDERGNIRAPSVLVGEMTLAGQ